MAVERTDKTRKMYLKVETGTTASGNAAYSNRLVPNVNVTLTDAKLYEVADALGELQTYPVGGIVVQDNAYLVSD